MWSVCVLFPPPNPDPVLMPGKHTNREIHAKKQQQQLITGSLLTAAKNLMSMTYTQTDTREPDDKKTANSKFLGNTHTHTDYLTYTSKRTPTHTCEARDLFPAFYLSLFFALRSVAHKHRGDL